MKILADENIDLPILDRLRKDGYNVLSIREMQPGMTDEEVINIANKQGALLLTSDKDFGELVFRQRRVSYGILLIRLAGLPTQHKGEIVATAINKHSDELIGNFTVVTSRTVRIRKQKNL